jgi:hypothetical protein
LEFGFWSLVLLRPRAVPLWIRTIVPRPINIGYFRCPIRTIIRTISVPNRTGMASGSAVSAIHWPMQYPSVQRTLAERSQIFESRIIGAASP